MKYWNKSKKDRPQFWTCVKLKPNAASFSVHFKLKTELQRQKSTGKFYMQPLNNEIWFEQSKDAVWFALRYSGTLI